MIMNERIQELADQCYEYKAEMLNIWFNKEKFAELIVLECIKLINERKSYCENPGPYQPSEYYARMDAMVDAFEEATSTIKYIFEVKE